MEVGDFIKDNIRFYLFEEMYSLLPDDVGDCAEYKLKILKRSMNNYNKLKSLTFFYNNVNGLLYKFTNFKNLEADDKKILFQNKRALYPSILEKVQDSYNVIVLGDNILSFFDYIKSPVNYTLIYFPIYFVYMLIYAGVIEKNESKLDYSLNILKKKIRDLNPDLIVLHEDGNIEGRALTLIAAQLNIPTITIQDGVFISSYSMIYGRSSDYMFVWGQYFKDIYLDQKIMPENNVKVLGYPHKIKKLRRIKKSKIVVYYLGQSYESCEKKNLKDKLKTIKNLKLICDKLGFDFYYRPHPSDNREYVESRITNIQFTEPSESLIQSIEKGDIFISFDSTALIEANLYSKIGVQLKNFNIETDNFEDIGACSKTCHNFDELEGYLREISENRDLYEFFKPVDSNFVKTYSTNPGTRFKEIIEDII